MIIVIILKYFLLMFLVSCILVQNWYNGFMSLHEYFLLFGLPETEI